MAGARATVNIKDRGFVLGLIGTISGCLSLGAVSVYMVMDGQLDDAKIVAGTAKSEARAQQSIVIATLAKDDLEVLRREFEIYKQVHK